MVVKFVFAEHDAYHVSSSERLQANRTFLVIFLVRGQGRDEFASLEHDARVNVAIATGHL